HAAVELVERLYLGVTVNGHGLEVAHVAGRDLPGDPYSAAADGGEDEPNGLAETELVGPRLLQHAGVRSGNSFVRCLPILVDRHNPPFGCLPNLRPLPTDDAPPLQVLPALLERSDLGPGLHRIAHRCTSP